MKSMRHWCKRALSVVPLLLGCSDGHFDSTSNAQQLALDDQRADLEALSTLPTVITEDVCPAGRGGMRCLAKRLTHMNGEPMIAHAAAPQPGWLGARDIQAAYKLPTSGGNHRTVAIVDAFHAPNAEADLAVYRAQYGLPPCTTANGCFRQLNQMGNPGPYPPPDAGWITEIMVDLDMVSATCPDCNILLVEANTSNGVDLGPCVALAAQLGAVSVNNSYGGPESDPDSVASFNFYTQPGTAVVASSGDDGYLRTPNDQGTILAEIAFPAASPAVVSVGGTSLRASTSTRGWAETAWRGAGSGCSKTQTKPTWQMDAGCTKRTVADVSAVGDPATGVAIYNSMQVGGPWIAIGGTSVSAPIIAGVFGLFNINDPAWAYAHPGSFFDVITGMNFPAGGVSCGTYQCIAGVGYDGPTGLGTPNGALFNAPAVDGGSGAGTGGRAGSGGAGGAAPATGTGGVGTTGTGGVAGVGGAIIGAGGFVIGGTGTAGSAGSTTGTASSTTGAPSTTTGPGPTGVGGSGTVTEIKPDEVKGCSCRVGAAPHSSTSDRARLFVLGLAGLVVRRRGRSRRARD